MEIGIIGAGNIGAILTRRLTTLGHRVRVANSRGPETLAALSQETGARAVPVRDAVEGVDLVVVTIPEKSVPALPDGLFARVPATVPVVDTANYYPPRDGRIEAIERGETESGWVASVLGHAVIKAFNSVTAHSLASGGRPAGSSERFALPVAGNEELAKSVVMRLADQLGFDTVDAGGIDQSWRQQPGTPAYCTDLDAAGLRRALEQADRKRAPLLRDEALLKLAKLPQGTTPAEVVMLARRLFAPRVP